ncbi:MAG: methionine--tRNA ligase subunit beta, partial [Clostridiales bacterium]|nr:methionine--tRNA ligase subunit beta [Clostridiales bacterium]
WVLAKDDSNKERLATVLYNLLETIRIVAVFLNPVMPNTTVEIWRQIGADSDATSWKSSEKFGVLPEDVTVAKGDVIFPRIDLDKEIDELNAVLASQNPVATEEVKQEIVLEPEITIDDFMKIELRVAKVISCEKVKKSDKLLCLQLDDGMGGRQVVSGIAMSYEPEELIGKKVMLVANLKPIKLRSVDSFGMICATDMADGGVKVMFVDDDVEVGTKIR